MSRQLQRLAAVFCLGISTLAVAGDVRGRVPLQSVDDAPGVLVYVEGVDGDYSAETKTVHLSQRGARFNPPIVALMKGDTIDMTNDDWIAHNVFARIAGGSEDATLANLLDEFDTGLYADKERKQIKLGSSGKFELYCSIHPHMRGALYVFDHPFFAHPHKDGTFELKNVPAGVYPVSVRFRDGSIFDASVRVPAKGHVVVKWPKQPRKTAQRVDARAESTAQLN